MRRVAVILVVALFSILFVAGCGGGKNVIGKYVYENIVTLELRADGTSLRSSEGIDLDVSKMTPEEIKTLGTNIGAEQQEGTYRVSGDTVIVRPKGMQIEFNYRITDKGLKDYAGNLWIGPK